MSTPRRIPTEEIEVGRWYRVEDAVPIETLEDCQTVGSWGCADEPVGPENAGHAEYAWRYNGPIPDSLPPREEKPKRFKLDSQGWLEDRDGTFGDRQVDASMLRCGLSSMFVALLNAGHEALEGGES